MTQPASLSFSFLPGTGNHGSAAWLSWVVVGINEVETPKSLQTIQGKFHLEFLQLPSLLSQAKDFYLLSCSSVKWEWSHLTALWGLSKITCVSHLTECLAEFVSSRRRRRRRSINQSPYFIDISLVFTWCPFSVPGSLQGTTAREMSCLLQLLWTWQFLWLLFWWPWQCWGVLISRFVECPSIGVFPLFLLWLEKLQSRDSLQNDWWVFLEVVRLPYLSRTVRIKGTHCRCDFPWLTGTWSPCWGDVCQVFNTFKVLFSYTPPSWERTPHLRRGELGSYTGWVSTQSFQNSCTRRLVCSSSTHVFIQSFLCISVNVWGLFHTIGHNLGLVHCCLLCGVRRSSLGHWQLFQAYKGDCFLFPSDTLQSWCWSSGAFPLCSSWLFPAPVSESAISPVSSDAFSQGMALRDQVPGTGSYRNWMLNQYSFPRSFGGRWACTGVHSRRANSLELSGQKLAPPVKPWGFSEFRPGQTLPCA